jgi:PfaD family protein
MIAAKKLELMRTEDTHKILNEEQIIALMTQSDRRLCLEKRGREIWWREDWPEAAALNASPEHVALVPAQLPEQLGSAQFRAVHQVRYAYVAGEMAGGIASEEMVIAMAKAGMLGFFGSGGLGLARIEQAIDTIQARVGSASYGFNLLHNPFAPHIEEATVELYLKKGVRRVSASAYVTITPYIVYFCAKGLKQDSTGRIIRQNHIFAKISRREVARNFMSPAPANLLAELCQQGRITPEEMALAKRIPIAEDVTAEADSGGHTDRRPFIGLLPAICRLRDEMLAQYGPEVHIRVGAAGGIATPASIAAALAMGADYVMSGSINQATLEAGTSTVVKEMLAKAESHDVMMAPAADMFENGVNVQVLKFATMFPMKAQRLYRLYKEYQTFDALPPHERDFIEKSIFRKTIDQVWEETKAHFQDTNPARIDEAEKNPRIKMALLCRWYLGMASRWAVRGEPARSADYQIWCGPAMGHFNEWVRGTFLEKLENRRVVEIAHNLLRGVCIIQRVNMLKMQGFPVPAQAYRIIPIPLNGIAGRIGVSL